MAVICIFPVVPIWMVVIDIQESFKMFEYFLFICQITKLASYVMLIRSRKKYILTRS